MKSRSSAAASFISLTIAALMISACSPNGVLPSAAPLATELPQTTSTTRVEFTPMPTINLALPTSVTPESAELPEAPPTVPPVPAATTEPPPVDAESQAAPGQQLAFLKNGDIWLLDNPESEPYQLTVAGDIQSFTWSSDGRRLAAFNGRSLCLFESDGSIRTACLELGLNDEQAQIQRRMIWSPDQRWVILWNPLNPQDEGAIGWLAIALDTSSAMWRIQDPVDWGAALAPDNEPGGFTGEPVFLADGSILGTISHRYLCGSGGCRYQLYSFDLTELTPTLSPYPNRPEEGWSEGRGLIFSEGDNILTNFGVVFASCENFHTYIDRFNLDDETRKAYTLENQAVDGLAISPDGKMILSRTAGCAPETGEVWSQTCSLSNGFEVLPMQHWDPETSQIEDLLPGTQPVWSPDGSHLAFRSCLSENATGAWEPDGGAAPGIFLMDQNGKIRFIEVGEEPIWKP